MSPENFEAVLLLPNQGSASLAKLCVWVDEQSDGEDERPR